MRWINDFLISYNIITSWLVRLLRNHVYNFNRIHRSPVMQRVKVGSSAGAASSQEAQADADDMKMRARMTVIASFVAFGAIVVGLRVGKCQWSIISVCWVALLVSNIASLWNVVVCFTGPTIFRFLGNQLLWWTLLFNLLIVTYVCIIIVSSVYHTSIWPVNIPELICISTWATCI